ncbi:hypothetical protein [Pseudomonas sp. M5]|uniref:hypothetical protein n=1 Tax=Pseudomonas sp. M5 TaxID=1620788 RepID=UPI00195E9EAA|nr:hypothetical protein [Pseudomonas sp. M5]MBM7396140.1 hypothetical protein [Pseudomonas sp. M5]HDS1755180.1 hypothetical protein [Pseudomonas putida]
MDIADQYQLIAQASGLTIGQVGTYLAKVVIQSDGAWLVCFAHELERDPDVASKLPASKTVLIPKQNVDAYDRAPG